MSDVMCIVTNHEENRSGPPFRANPFGLLVMSDVMLHCNVSLSASSRFLVTLDVICNRNCVVRNPEKVDRCIAEMRSPGFEPGSSAWEADVLARLDYDRTMSWRLMRRKMGLNFYLAFSHTRS